MPPDLEATWTAFPSLLLLMTANEQQALEAAVCAGLCGRQVESDQLFAKTLSGSETAPAYVFSRADLLTNASRELDRYQLLRNFVSEQTTDQAMHVLLRFMVADNNFWVFGNVQDFNDARKATKRYLASKNISKLTDLELRCITLYYDATSHLTQNSNLITEQDKIIFTRSFGNRYAEVRRLRETLQSENRYRFAPIFMQLEMNNCPSFEAFQQSLSIAEDMVQYLIKHHQKSLQYRGAVLANQLAARLTQHGMQIKASRLKQIKTMALQSIMSTAFTHWEEFCPSMAADDESARITASEGSLKAKSTALGILADRCIATKSYTKANQAMQSVRNNLHDSWVMSQDPSLLPDIRSSGLKFYEFHKTKTYLAYFEGVALGDYIARGWPRDKPNRMIVDLIQDYMMRHKSMEITSILERLSGLGKAAAEALADTHAIAEFEALNERVLNKTSFMNEGGDFTDDIILDRFHSTRVITAHGNDAVSCGIGSLHLMLRWASYEITTGNLTPAQAVSIFSEDVASSIDSIEEQSNSLFHKICGTQDTLAEATEFMKSYEKMLSWIFTPGAEPSELARALALKYFLQARLYLHAEHLRDLHNSIDKNADPATLKTQKQAFDSAREASSQEEIALSALDKRASIRPTENDVREIQQLLTRLHAPDIKNPVSMEKLDGCIIKCRHLVDTYKAESALIHQYGSLAQLIRLNWHKAVIRKDFTSLEIQPIIELVEEAELLCDDIKKNLASTQVSAEFIAAVKSSTDYLQAEHYKYVFAALDCCYTVSQQKQDVVDQIANWSIRSKARAIKAIVNKAKPSSRDDDLIEITQALDLSSSPPGRIIDEINSMLEDDVIIMDLVEVSYSISAPKILSLVYRQGKPVTLTEIPLAMAKIQDWVQENLDSKDVCEDPLINPGSQEQLGELAKLVEAIVDGNEPCFVPENTVIVFCATGALHRVPMHAINIGQGLLFHRNPIMYTQSIELLYQTWKRGLTANLTHTSEKTIINPLDSTFTTSSVAKEVAKLMTHLTALHGTDISPEQALQAMQQRSIFAFLGHANFDSQALLNSNLELGGGRRLTLQDILDNVSLRFPAICALIACASGKTIVTTTDDVISMPTAFNYAGASCTMSTLWPVDELDGAAFANIFFRNLNTAAAAGTEQTNLARIMQKTLIELYKDLGEKNREQPNHWAAFFMQGFWSFPTQLI